MFVTVVLVDVNPKMVAAWKATFEENPEVEVVSGSMLAQAVDAWVSPTNSKGRMDGGLDAVVKKHLGDGIESQLQKEINVHHGGTLPVGFATCVPTGKPQPKFLISTPTMVASSQDISDSLNVALACAAAFQAVHVQNEKEPNSIQSIALPGLGANTGKVPVEICADLMWTGYDLFRRKAFPDFATMRAALAEKLGGDLGPMTGTTPKPTVKPPAGATKSPPPAKPAVEDFDDSEG